MSLGLKGCLKSFKGAGLGCKITVLFVNLVYIWQRVWRGYDDRDLYDCDIMFRDRMKKTLEALRNEDFRMWAVPEQYINDFENKWLSNEQVENILDTMLFHLEMMDDNYVEKLLYKENILEIGYSCNRTENEYMRIYAIRNQNKDAFMKLFNLFYWDLCD